MYYRRLCKHLDDKGVLIPANTVEEDSINQYVDDFNTDWYLSVFKYNQEQYDDFQQTGSIKGITDVVTDKIWFDFDSETELELARENAVLLCDRLMEAGIDRKNLMITFSGNKGFGVELNTTQTFNPKQARELAINLAKDMMTFDIKMYNASRILRVMGTKHKKTGLYKIPLTFNQLNELSADEILKLAANNPPGNDEFEWNRIDLPESILDMKKEAPTKDRGVTPRDILEVKGLDWTTKPKFLTNCRWPLQNGFFSEGERSTALLCLAASYKNLGFDQEHVYRLLKGVATLQAKRNDTDRFPDDQIWSNIILQVFEKGWNNGQYTCKDEGSWLHQYCEKLGDRRCEHKKENFTVKTDDVFSLFRNYAENYEKNVLYTGIHDLDKKSKLMIGTSNAILAPPGVGKTSIALQILEHNSNQGIDCILYSYDMFHSALYMRMVQRETGLDQDDIYHIFRFDEKKADAIREVLNEKYKHVHFCFRSGQTIEELDETIVTTEDKIGRKVKLIIPDYSELISTGISDPTASSAQVAQRLRQISNEREVCNLVLLQPSKNFSSPGDEITNYNAAKGSSSIVQSLTLLLGCSRPGFNPLEPEMDRFFNITCLKNRNGPLFSVDLSWDGLRGMIDTLTDEQREELKEIRNQKAQQKADDGSF
jgi:hypothetical protein